MALIVKLIILSSGIFCGSTVDAYKFSSIFVLHPESYSATMNSSLVLQCKVSSPVSNIVWMHSTSLPAQLSFTPAGVPVATSSFSRRLFSIYHISPVHSLLVVRFESPASQSGYYWCELLPGNQTDASSLLRGQFRSRASKLHLADSTGAHSVLVDAKYTRLSVSITSQHVATIVAFKGADVILPCRLQPAETGEGNVNVVEWTHGETGIRPDSRTSESKSMLLINSVRPSDSGVYTCWGDAADLKKEFLQQWELIVVGPPAVGLAFSPVVIVADVGSLFEIDCPVQSHPFSTSVLWFRNGALVSLEPPFIHQRLRTKNRDAAFSLVIAMATNSDAGQYECVAKNRFGSVRITAATVRLSTACAGSDCQSPAIVTSSVGATFKIGCREVGANFCLLSWQPLALPVTPVQAVLLTSVATRRQVTYNANVTGDGQVRTEEEAAGPFSMLLTGLKPGVEYTADLVPLLTQTQRRSRRSLPSAGQARFRTQTAAVAPSTAKTHQLADLQLASVTPWSARVSWDTGSLLVTGRPCSRVEFRLTPYEEVNDGSTISADSSASAASAIAAVAACTAASVDLTTEPHRRYRLVALPVFADQQPAQSTILRFATPQDVPGRPPVGLQASSATPATFSTPSGVVVSLAWQPPPVAWQHGVVVGYTVQWRPAVAEAEAEAEGAEQAQQRSLRLRQLVVAGERSCKLRGLPPGRLFAARVAARTAAGLGPFTPWVAFYTGSAPPRDLAAVFGSAGGSSSLPAAASRVDLLRIKPDDIIRHGKKDSIVLSWTRPSSVVPDKYRIFYGTQQPKDSIAGEIPGDQDSYQIKNLRSDTLYFIAIMAVKDGYSVETVIEAQTLTGEGKDDGNKQPPSVPMAVKVTQVSSRTAIVTWTDPQRTPGMPGYDSAEHRGRLYEVEWAVDSNGASASSADPFRRNTTDLSLRLGELRPSLAYLVRVRCHVEFAPSSEYSMRAAFTTLAEAPSSPPRDLKVSRANLPRSVMLSWLPPLEPNGKVAKYTVLYRPAVPETSEHHSTFTADTQVVITGLRPSALYYFRVRAENNEGSGPESNVTMFMTPDSFGQGGGVVFNTDTDSVIQRASPEGESDGLSSRKWWLLICGVFILAVLLLAAATAALCLCHQRPRGGSGGGGGDRSRGGAKESASLIGQQESGNQQQGPPSQQQQQPPQSQLLGNAGCPASPGSGAHLHHHTAAAMLVGQQGHLQHQLQQHHQPQTTPDLCRHADFELRQMDFMGGGGVLAGMGMRHPMQMQPPPSLFLDSGPVPNPPGHFRNLSNPGYPTSQQQQQQQLQGPQSQQGQGHQGPPIPPYPGAISRVGSVVAPPRVDAPDFSSPGKLSSPHSSLSSSIGSASKQRHTNANTAAAGVGLGGGGPPSLTCMSASSQPQPPQSRQPYPAPPDILNPAPGSRQHQHAHHQLRASQATTGGSSTLESQTSRHFALSIEDLDMAKTLDGLMNDLKCLTNKEFEC